jgi:uncharacterized repeat protein (TIGR03803 family)
MPSKKPLVVFFASFTFILGSLTITTPVLAASTEKLLHKFCSAKNCADGVGPSAGLIFGNAGTLYGTTSRGGTGSGCNGGSGCGTVFELIRNTDKWTEKVLYSFCSASGCPDGWFPLAGLVSDSTGNLYGTTFYGGNEGTQCAPTGCGTVFELVANNGKWTEKVLHTFCSTSSCPSGGGPGGGVIFDASGNLYGTAQYGGLYGFGTVFELSPSNGGWTEKVIHNFNNNGKDGFYPHGGLTLDSAGNLYGTTAQGGANACGGVDNCGTVFELIRSNGGWTEKVLYNFEGNGKDGYFPAGGVTLDATGNVYGATESGGADSLGCGGFGCGTVFVLTHNNGKWAEEVLYSFTDTPDGSFPWQPILDEAGNIYGTTNSGGLDGVGTVFEIVHDNGRWIEKTLHSFGNRSDGRLPLATVVRDKAGNLYGTTGGGGGHHSGTVFKVTP